MKEFCYVYYVYYYYEYKAKGVDVPAYVWEDVGVYSDGKRAEEAVEKWKQHRYFCDHPDKFIITRRTCHGAQKTPRMRVYRAVHEHFLPEIVGFQYKRGEFQALKEAAQAEMEMFRKQAQPDECDTFYVQEFILDEAIPALQAAEIERK